MKVKSVSGVVLLVRDLKRTAAFYEKIGFRLGKQQDKRLTAYVNWFWLEFVVVEESRATGNDNEFIYLAVGNVDEVHNDLRSLKLQPTDPADFDSGRRETMITDPDGYKLVFFTK